MAFADHLDLDTFVAFGTMGPGFTRDAFQRERIDPIVIAHLVDLRDAGFFMRTVLSNRLERLHVRAPQKAPSRSLETARNREAHA